MITDYSKYQIQLGKITKNDYILSSAAIDALGNYLPLSGGEISGDVKILSGNYIQENVYSTATNYATNSFIHVDDDTFYGDVYVGAKGYCVLCVDLNAKKIKLSGDLSELSIALQDTDTYPNGIAFTWDFYNTTFPSKFTVLSIENDDQVVACDILCSNMFANAELTTINAYNTEEQMVSLFNSGINMFYSPKNPSIGNVILPYRSQFASGASVKALQWYAHAEGRGTIADGRYSHTEGHESYAGGLGSHAEGFFTKAYGNRSHVEGTSTQTYAPNTHAEGNYSVAYGTASHAEGGYTEAGGAYSHAEGYYSKANSNYSHAEGHRSFSKGLAAHAEGGNTSALTSYTHAEGGFTKSLYDGINSTTNKLSSSNYYFAGGTAKGIGAHAEGIQTSAIGVASHAEGGFHNGKTYLSTFQIYPGGCAKGNASHAEGMQTIAIGDASHAEGTQTIAFKETAHSEGKYTIAGGTGSHAEGVGSYKAINLEVLNLSTLYSPTFASSLSTFGQADTLVYFPELNISAYVKSYEQSGTTISIFLNNEISQLESIQTVDVAFYKSIAKGDQSHIEGNSTKAFGTSAHAEGSNTKAIGNYSHTEGVSTVANGERSHVEGSQSKTYGINSHAEGNYSVAYGTASHAEGYYSLAGGNYSHIEGYGTQTAYSLYGSNTSTLISSIANSTIRNNLIKFGNEKYGIILEGNNGQVSSTYCLCSSIDGNSISIYLGKSINWISGETINLKFLTHAAIGNYSHSGGEDTRSIGKTSYAIGVKSIATDNYSYVWNGLSGSVISSNGEGTFNINPKNGISGFYIGVDNLANVIDSRIPTLPTAKNDELGGIKIGYVQNGHNYPVQLSNQQAYVNVPWTDVAVQSAWYEPTTNQIVITFNDVNVDQISVNVSALVDTYYADNKTLTVDNNVFSVIEGVFALSTDVTNDLSNKADVSSLTAYSTKEDEKTISSAAYNAMKQTLNKNLSGLFSNGESDISSIQIGNVISCLYNLYAAISA